MSDWQQLWETDRLTIALPDGRVFPEYAGEALSWSIGLYMTTAEAAAGYPRARRVIAAMKAHRPAQLWREHREMVRASFGIFGRNARAELELIEEMMGVV